MNTVQPRIIHHAFKGEGCCRYAQLAEGYSNAQDKADSPQTHLDEVMHAEGRLVGDSGDVYEEHFVCPDPGWTGHIHRRIEVAQSCPIGSISRWYETAADIVYG
jgi:hypothetical protein